MYRYSCVTNFTRSIPRRYKVRGHVRKKNKKKKIIKLIKIWTYARGYRCIILKRRDCIIYPNIISWLRIREIERKRESELEIFGSPRCEWQERKKNGIKIPWEGTFHATVCIIRIFVRRPTYIRTYTKRDTQSERRMRRISSNIRPR